MEDEVDEEEDEVSIETKDEVEGDSCSNKGGERAATKRAFCGRMGRSVASSVCSGAWRGEGSEARPVASD